MILPNEGIRVDEGERLDSVLTSIHGGQETSK